MEITFSSVYMVEGSVGTEEFIVASSSVAQNDPYNSITLGGSNSQSSQSVGGN